MLTGASGQVVVTPGMVQQAKAMGRDDMLRRCVIMSLMCQGTVELESVEQSWLVDFRQYFAAELEQLQPLVEQGLVEITPDAVNVTELGWYFVRGVAMVFDKYLQADRTRARFSKII